jgi:hypothetical protein
MLFISRMNRWVNKLPSIFFLDFACALDFPLFYLFDFMGQRLRAVAFDVTLIIASGQWESRSGLSAPSVLKYKIF